MEEEKISMNDLYKTFLERMCDIEQEIKDIKYDVTETRKEIIKLRAEFFVSLNEMTGQILDGLRACQKGY